MVRVFLNFAVYFVNTDNKVRLTPPVAANPHLPNSEETREHKQEQGRPQRLTQTPLQR